MNQEDLSNPKKKLLFDSVRKDYDSQFFNVFASNLFRMSYSKASNKIVFNID